MAAVSTTAGLRGTNEAPQAIRREERVSLRVLVLADDALTAEALGAILRRSPSVRIETALTSARLPRANGRRSTDVVVWFAGHVDDAALLRLERARERLAVPFCIVARSVDPVALRGALFSQLDTVAVLLRGARPQAADLFRTIVQLVSGRTVLTGALLEELLDDGEDCDDLLAGLAPSELEVLELLALGLRNGAIARRLKRSEKSVEKLVGSLFAKLGLEAAGDPDVDRRVSAARLFLACTGAAPPRG
jgi:DNA-binding NarL/FixJ family response regulator